MTFKKELMLLGAAAATSTVAYFIHLENKKNEPKGAEEVLSLSPDTWVGSKELAKKIQKLYKFKRFFFTKIRVFCFVFVHFLSHF